MAMDASRLAGPWWQRPLSSPAFRQALDGQRPAKGEFGGECQRVACDSGDARWFNQTSGRYYCTYCARIFNEVSRRHGQAPLCELHP